MQDKFVADVGDFGKYGLLRWLGGVTSDGRRLRLGVIWYYVETDGSLPDLGQAFNYLFNPGPAAENLIGCDPVLYGILQNLINMNQRSVSAVQGSGVLPDDTVFFRDPVNGGLPRIDWSARAIDAVRDCDLVFLDPDNGLADTPDVEHATYGEAAEIYGTGKSLVIYQHTDRSGTVDEQIMRHAASLREALGITGSRGKISALRFHRVSSRIFFVIPNPANPEVERLLRERVGSFMASCWGEGGHFTRVDC